MIPIKTRKIQLSSINAKAKATAIDFDGIEQRLELLPPAAGNYNALAATKGKIIFLKYPNTGAPDGKGILKYWI
jgi:tricorn protease